jgi:hypothetical protein
MQIKDMAVKICAPSNFNVVLYSNKNIYRNE